MQRLHSGKESERSSVVSNLKIRNKFQAFAAPLINKGISLFTDGSRREDKDSAVGAAIYSPELGIIIKHKLPRNFYFLYRGLGYLPGFNTRQKLSSFGGRNFFRI